jgi:hypothetical protein
MSDAAGSAPGSCCWCGWPGDERLWLGLLFERLILGWLRVCRGLGCLLELLLHRSRNACARPRRHAARGTRAVAGVLTEPVTCHAQIVQRPCQYPANHPFGLRVQPDSIHLFEVVIAKALRKNNLNN